MGNELPRTTILVAAASDDAPLLPESLLRTDDPDLKARVKKTLLLAGLRLRKADAGRLTVHADSVTADAFVRLKPLQNAEGKLRADAAKTLALGEHLTEDDARAMAETMRAAYPPDKWSGHAFQGFQLELLANVEPVRTLAEFIDVYPEARLFALTTTKRFHFLDTFWRLAADAAAAGKSLEDMRDRKLYPRPTAVTGVAYIFAAHLVCGPLVARNQPLAAVFETLGGTQLIAIAPGSWTRPPGFADWPTGSGYSTYFGLGDGLYKTRFDKIPDHAGRTLLEESLAAANRIIGMVNDPGRWVRENAELDTVERQIAWSTLDLGFNTIAVMGADWTSDESLWVAFRALGALQGYWRMKKLDRLFDPEAIGEFAISKLPKGFAREYAEDLVGNYAGELQNMYPDDEPGERLARLREIRNVVHGTGADFGERDRRLRALLGLGSGGLHLLRDMAVTWWASLLFAPETNGAPGSPPWAEAAASEANGKL